MKDLNYSRSRCGENIRGGDVLKFGDSNTFNEGESLCYTCYYEDEPVATVLYGSDNEPYQISYTRNDTEGDFWVEWRPSDLWRGRYEVKSKKYRKLFSDSILAYHESEEMLKNLNDLVTGRFDELRLDYARSFSNCLLHQYPIRNRVCATQITRLTEVYGGRFRLSS